MQVTNTPNFQCRELNELFPKLNRTGQILWDKLPATQKTASHATLFFIAASCFSSPILVAYGMYALTTVPIVAALGCTSVVLLVANKIFGVTENTFLYAVMKNIPRNLDSKSIQLVSKMLLNFHFNSDTDSEARFLLIAHRALTYTQFALNEFQKSYSHNSLLKFDLKQNNPTVAKMRDSAEKAYQVIMKNKNLFQQGNAFGITQEHVDILNLLRSVEKKGMHFVEDIENANVFLKERNKIEKAIETLETLVVDVPMVDYTDLHGARILGLGTYLNEPIQTLKKTLPNLPILKLRDINRPDGANI